MLFPSIIIHLFLPWKNAYVHSPLHQKHHSSKCPFLRHSFSIPGPDTHYTWPSHFQEKISENIGVFFCMYSGTSLPIQVIGIRVVTEHAKSCHASTKYGVPSFIDTNLIHNFYINYIKWSSSTCFERRPLIFRRSMMLIVHVCSLWYSHSLQVAILCTR